MIFAKLELRIPRKSINSNDIDMKFLIIICSFFLLTSCDDNSATKQARADIPNLEAGNYTLDKTHASLVLRVGHLGISKYTMQFKRFDAALNLDPKNPKNAAVKAVIDAASIETNFLTSQIDFNGDLSAENDETKAHKKIAAAIPLMKKNFNETIAGKEWLDAAQFPLITFTSRRVEMTSKTTAQISGDLTLHGVTKPVTLEARFNGGYAPNNHDPFGSRIGFSARGKINRSDFGITYGIPEKGSRLGVADEIEVVMEMEFVKPTTKNAAK
jgi:polyisoprenoid-binding protein YceI